MRVMIIDNEGLKITLSLTTTIDTLMNVYNELKSIGSEMNVIEYKEVLENGNMD